MLHGRRLTTLLLIVVLLNPSRIDSDRNRGTRDVDKDGNVIAGTSNKAAQQNDQTKLKHDVAAAPHERQIQEKPVIHHAREPGQDNEKHDENSIENESHSEKEGEIQIEVSDRHKRDEGAEKESDSGDESRVEVKDVNFHVHRSDPRGEKSEEDDEDVVNLSGSERVSVEDEDKIPEDDDGNTTLQVENDRKKSGEPVNKEILEDNKEKPDGQRKNTRNKKKIPKKNIRKKQQKKVSKLKLHAEIDLMHKKNHLFPRGKTIKKTKGAISVSKARRKPMIGEVESEKGTDTDLNNAEDFYPDKSDEPKERMFAEEMQDVKNDKGYGENTNRGEKRLEERKKIDHEDGEHEFSGEDSDIDEFHVHGKESRDFNSHHPVDDEEARNDWEHFQMHLHSHEKNDDEFGYITNDDSEENDDESLSGERDYDHTHIKTLHVDHRAKHVKHSRDSNVMGKIAGEEDGESDDEQSGEGDDLNSIYDRRDLPTIEQENESEDHEGSLITEDEEDVVNSSGSERVSVRDEDKIPEDNDRNTSLQVENATKKSGGLVNKEILEDNKEKPDGQRKNTMNKKKIPKKNIRKKQQKSSWNKKKGPAANNQVSKLKLHAEIDLMHKKKHLFPRGKTNKKTKGAISASKARKKPMIGEVESEKGTDTDLNNAEDFYPDKSDEPKERMFAEEMQDVKNDKGYGENTNREEKRLEERKKIDHEDGEHEFSGEDSDIDEFHVHGKESRDFNSHHQVDDEEARNDWEHFQMHLHSHEKNDDEFGYITNDDSEENDGESLSGEREYDHAHIKTLHVHHRAKHVNPRDSHVIGKIAGEEDGESDDEQSGEGDGLNSIYDGRDLPTIEQENESEDHEGSLITEDEEDVVNSSGSERVSVRDEDKIPEDNDADTTLQVENDREKSGGPVNKEILEDNKEKPDGQRKNTRNKKKIPKKNIRKKQQKSSWNKKKGPAVNTQVSHQSQKLKVHAEIDLSQNDTKSATSVLKSRKNPKIREVESEKRTESDLNNADDFYLDESDQPKERTFAVEMQDGKNDKDYGENTNPGYRKISKRVQTEDDKAESGYEFKRGSSRHLLQIMNTTNPFTVLPESSAYCTHEALHEKIADQSIVYIRMECRLCQCTMGELICDPKPEHCDQHLAKPCAMSNGELADGGRHFDGCNNCVCRNGELLCTRIRCTTVNYNYTKYRTGSDNKTTLENSLAAILDEVITRGTDRCMECDNVRVSPVCGPNWKTYRSVCHAFHCGGFNIEDMKQGKCESFHPCDGIKCADHEICIPDRRGPCLATTTRDGDLIECPQHQCVIPNETSNCSTAQVEKMCGEDHNIYMSKCSMFSRGVSLAYYGPCQDKCLEIDAKVCGVDGETFQSPCHASLHNSHVDYPGQCDEVYPTNDNSFKNSAFGHFNPRCETVTKLLRCPGADCQNNVIPEGSCCPICGTAISIRLDTAARDMTSLNARVQPPEDLNRVDAIFTGLKNLFDQFGGVGMCQLTVDLADTHDISVVYEPITSQDEDTCKQVATRAVEFINSPDKSDVEPAKALLAVAVIKDSAERTGLPRAESMIAKRLVKRSGHHDHNEPFFDKSHRICLHHYLLLFLVGLSLYWSTNQS